ncbi:MAG: TetR/AcrR family transcriptional regulator [Leucobacter sp.]|nr:TetR/AcrR family transcriptional regulator [Leucobacter sp.]
MNVRQVYKLPDWGKTDARVLDAAERLLITRGLEGLTITSIAKEADVSRPTVYRRWPSIDEIMRATLLRATLKLLKQVGSLPHTRTDLAIALVELARVLRGNHVFRSLIDRHPDFFIHGNMPRLGASQLAVISWLADSIEYGQGNGTVRQGPPSDMGTMLLLIVQSAILSHTTVTAMIGSKEFETELCHAIEGYLHP